MNVSILHAHKSGMDMFIAVASVLKRKSRSGNFSLSELEFVLCVPVASVAEPNCT